MGVPTSEVGYTPPMPRREDHEVHKGHVVALWGGTSTKLNLDMDNFPLQPKNTLKLKLGWQVVRVNKFCVMAPDIFVCSVQNVLLVSLLAPRILRSLLGFWKICGRSVRVGDRKGAYSVLVGRRDGTRTLCFGGKA